MRMGCGWRNLLVVYYRKREEVKINDTVLVPKVVEGTSVKYDWMI